MTAKQVIVIRKDLGMKKGKMTSQGAHSSLGVFLKMMNGGKTLHQQTPEIVNGKYTLSLEVEVGSGLDNWLRGIYRKITLAVQSETELLQIYEEAKQKGIPAFLVKDEGLTVFNGVKTNTCICIGPYDSGAIDEITGHLPLMS